MISDNQNDVQFREALQEAKPDVQQFMNDIFSLEFPIDQNEVDNKSSVQKKKLKLLHAKQSQKDVLS